MVQGGVNLTNLGVTALSIDDLYRGAWLQAVSALDSWAHEEISRRVAAVAQGLMGPLPGRLKALTLTVGQAEDIRLGMLSLEEVVTEAVDAALKRATLQRPRALAEAFRHVSDIELWPKVGEWIRANHPDFSQVATRQITAQLDAVVERRNQIAHGADSLEDGTGGKRPIDARSTAAALRLVLLIAAGVTAVLGEVLQPDSPDGRSQDSSRRPSSVALIAQAQVLKDGQQLSFKPAPAVAAKFAQWLAENPDRGRATWIADGSVKPLRWALDGQAYSASALVGEIFAQAGIEGSVSYDGPTWWSIDGVGTLSEIAQRLHHDGPAAST
jgi:restriction system protein